jgi:outer membrane protein assembly factor BamD (BamD/ComL family)
MERAEPQPTTRRGRALLALALLASASGCQSGAGPLARWRLAFDDSLAKSPTDSEVGQRRNLLKRWIVPSVPESNAAEVGSSLVMGSDGWSPLKAPSDPQAESEFQAAESLFQQGKLDEAERGFGKLARRKKGSGWGEKAQFYLAECQYQRGKLVAAHDSYEALIATYPGTQYLEKTVAREYAIADTWLASVAHDAKPDEEASLGDRWSGRLPMVDVAGHALAALEHVRHHDPTGPLSDDAVLRIADFHASRENHEDAALYYDQLITDHPKSPFLQKAQLAAIDSKLKAYLGPDYDGTGLEQARDQAIQTMAMFPERQVSDNDSLEHTLDVINEQMAERAYHTGEHYLWTGKVASAEYCFGEIPVKWPKSPYAKKAKEKLAKIASMPRKETKASQIMAMPGSTDPLTGSTGVSSGGFSGSPNGMTGGLGGPVGP